MTKKKAAKRSASKAKSKSKSTRSKGSKSRRGRSSARRAADGSFDLGTDKLYFKIGEVSDIVEVAAHVLRYWETEFPIIKPQKSRSQQRVYRRRDVENLLRIKHLLYERKFTIAGARQELRGGSKKVPPAQVSGLYKARQSLGRVREQFELLQAAVQAEPESAYVSADPADFIRSIGGARALLEQGGEPQPMLSRPDRDPR